MNINAVPISAYRHHGGFIFLSGQLAIDNNGIVVSDGIEVQTEIVLGNCDRLLREQGSNLSRVIKVTAWLSRKEDFAGFNSAYAAAFDKSSFPARSTVVSELLIERALVEIELVAIA